LIANSSKPDPNGVLSQIRAYRQKNAVDKKAIVLNKLNFQNESSISSEILIPFDISTTKGRTSLTHERVLQLLMLTRDGSQLIFSGDMDSIENPDRSLESEIYLADSDGNNFKMILGEEKNLNASLSHSGKMLAFLSSTTSFVSVPTLADAY
jgi:Tol biopolymer transport system component